MTPIVRRSVVWFLMWGLNLPRGIDYRYRYGTLGRDVAEQTPYYRHCSLCRSQAINPQLHGRDNTNLDLCDVCYWRKRADSAEAACLRLLAEVKELRQNPRTERSVG